MDSSLARKVIISDAFAELVAHSVDCNCNTLFIAPSAKAVPPDTTFSRSGDETQEEFEVRYWKGFIDATADPMERKFVVKLLNLFMGMAADVLANMKKAPAGRIEAWLFPVRAWEKEFEAVGGAFFKETMVLEAVRAQQLLQKRVREVLAGKEIQQRGKLHVVKASPSDYAVPDFDVENPHVASLLRSRSIEFSRQVVGTTESQVRGILANGIQQGYGMPQLRGSIEGYFRGDPIADRAGLIARTETIWAANAGANEMYRQSGVVEGKEWLISDDNRTCPYCRAMAGTYGPGTGGVPLDGTFANRGDVVKGYSPPPRIMADSAGSLVRCFGGTKAANPRPDPCRDYVRVGEDWFLQGEKVEGEELARLKGYGAPPGWTDVVAARDPTAKMRVVAKDAAGRTVYRYDPKYLAAKSDEKHDRVVLFKRDLDGIRKKISDGIREGDPRAYLMRIEDKTVIRIGSDKDFKAKVKAYGLTTLQNEHVSVAGDITTFKFVAKEGIPAHYELKDKTIADWITTRKETGVDGKKLFPDVPAKKFNKYLKDIADGKDYTVKDFRTFHATRIAYEELTPYAGKILTTAEKKQVIKDVSEKASAFLHNTPEMAKNTYISPMVWEMIGGL